MRAWLNGDHETSVKRPFLVQLCWPWATYLITLQILVSAAALLLILAMDFGGAPLKEGIAARVFLTSFAFAALAAPFGIRRERAWGYLLEFVIGSALLAGFYFDTIRDPKWVRSTPFLSMSNLTACVEWISGFVLLGYCLIHGITLVIIERRAKRVSDVEVADEVVPQPLAYEAEQTATVQSVG
jgi:hypothetical protein